MVESESIKISQMRKNLFLQSGGTIAFSQPPRERERTPSSILLGWKGGGEAENVQKITWGMYKWQWEG
jgi:hypothetical protein